MNDQSAEFPDFLIKKEGDIVIRRREKVFIVRAIKRYQLFAPRFLLNNIDPWMLLLTIIVGVARVIPSFFARSYQCGVILVDSEYKQKTRVLAKKNVPNLGVADEVKADFLTRVQFGDFDDL